MILKFSKLLRKKFEFSRQILSTVSNGIGRTLSLHRPLKTIYKLLGSFQFARPAAASRAIEIQRNCAIYELANLHTTFARLVNGISSMRLQRERAAIIRQLAVQSADSVLS